MGNCINLLSSPAEKAKVHICDEGEKEHKASKLVDYHGNECSLPHPGTKFEPGKAGRLLPHLVQPHDHSISFRIIRKETCQGRSIKIVVTRQQLQFLLRDAKMFQSIKKAIRSTGTYTNGNRKWRPSLSAIPEVPDF